MSQIQNPLRLPDPRPPRPVHRRVSPGIGGLAGEQKSGRARGVGDGLGQEVEVPGEVWVHPSVGVRAQVEGVADPVGLGNGDGGGNGGVTYQMSNGL